MKKDLKYLNSKRWYRLIKVLYVFGLLLVLTVAALFVADNYTPEINSKKSNIACSNGVTIDSSIYSLPKEGWINYNRVKFECLQDSELLGYLREKYPVYSDIDDQKLIQSVRQKFRESDLERAVDFDLSTYLNSLPKNYEVSIKYSFVPFFRTALLSAIILLGIFFCFEVIKRIFYYVYLGKLFPPKQEYESN